MSLPVRFHGAESDSRYELTEAGSDELVAGSIGSWVEVGGCLSMGSEVVLDCAVSEELDVAFEERLEGASEGESESVRGSGSDAGSVGELVTVGLGVCAGVGSCGSVQITCPSATYHTSLCLFSSFKGLHTHTHGKTQRETQPM